MLCLATLMSSANLMSSNTSDVKYDQSLGSVEDIYQNIIHNNYGSILEIMKIIFIYMLSILELLLIVTYKSSSPIMSNFLGRFTMLTIVVIH